MEAVDLLRRDRQLTDPVPPLVEVGLPVLVEPEPLLEVAVRSGVAVGDMENDAGRRIRQVYIRHGRA